MKTRTDTSLPQDPQMGRRSWWTNELPRLEPRTFPWGAFDDDGELLMKPIDLDTFLRLIPTDGWTGSFTRYTRDEGLKITYYGMILGMEGGVAWTLGGEAPTEYFRVGCHHFLTDTAGARSRMLGSHTSECRKCGLTIHSDSTG